MSILFSSAIWNDLVYAVPFGLIALAAVFVVYRSNIKTIKIINEHFESAITKISDARTTMINHYKDMMIHEIMSVPNGMSKEEYFDELSKVLSQFCFSEIVRLGKTEQDDIYEGFFVTYHKQTLKQASIQFWLGIATSIIGFIYIIISISISLDSEIINIVLNALPGIMIEVISVLFLNQTKETRSRAAEYFSKLSEEKISRMKKNQISQSLALADTIFNIELKDKVKSELALKLISDE